MTKPPVSAGGFLLGCNVGAMSGGKLAEMDPNCSIEKRLKVA